MTAKAQFASLEQAVQKNMKKKKWTKAQQLLEKSLSKDSSNTVANYLFSVFFFSEENPSYQVDSAYRYANEALNDFSQAGSRERNRLSRIPIDSLSLMKHRGTIEAAGFQRAKATDTEGAYLNFLAMFPFATQREEAIVLRDEAAYRDALKANTYEAFLRFFETYPHARRAGEAKATYERLLYEAKTNDRTLRSYELFLMEYPATPYRRDVEKHILDIMTASGEPSTFLSFTQKYPRSGYRKRAENILFHLLRDSEHSPMFNINWSDSLMLVAKRDADFLIPVLKNGKFGFMDSFGKLIIPHTALRISDDYKCGNITEDILIIDGKLTGRSGQMLTQDTITELEDLGVGFLKVRLKNRFRVLHKSGLTIIDDIEDARLLNDRFLAIKRQGRWDLASLNGLILTSEGFDDITVINSVVAFKKNNKVRLSTAMLIADVANNFALKFSVPYDQVRPLSPELLSVKINGLQSIIDRQLQVLLPFAEGDIESIPLGFAQREKDIVNLYDHEARFLGKFNAFYTSGSMVAVSTDTAMSFFNATARRIEPIAYDSITFAGPFPVTFRKDSITVLFDRVKKRFPSRYGISYLAKKDSTGYLLVRENGKKAVFDLHGTQIFTGEYENIEYAGENYFIVHRKEKKGLVSKTGKLILPVEYDAIGNVVNGVVTLLKTMKFGAYNISLRKLIKPQYDKNIIAYNAHVLAVFQKGQYRFIDWSNKATGKDTFDEVQHWSDTIALARSGFSWTFYDIYKSHEVLGSIKKLHYIRNSDEEKLAIVLQDNNYGVASNLRGIIIPPTFSHIANVGSKDHPVYFTEKHVEEASIFVVIYYDERGRLLKREVYEEEDYEKIFCPNN